MVPSEFKDILIKINIDKSDESLKMAEISIRENALMVAFNRIYYAIFYTVTALAEKHEFKTSKHTTMQGWFNQKFVHQDKLFTREISEIYSEAFKYRQKGDYDALYQPDLQKAEELLKQARVFLDVVRNEI